jgi:uncharacterized membrane protein YecN with MAPEG domain
MTPPIITGLIAAILALVFIVLQLNVIRLRVRTGISLFHGDNKDLGVAIRRHGNLAENLPLALILVGLLEMLGGPDWAIFVLGIALIASRIIHPFGLSYDDPGRVARAIGAVTTSLVMLISSLWLIGIFLNP